MRQTNLSFSSLSSSFPSIVQLMNTFSRNWLKAQKTLSRQHHMYCLFNLVGNRSFKLLPDPTPLLLKVPSRPLSPGLKLYRQLFSTRHTYIWKCVSKSVLNIKERLTCITNNRFATINKKTRKPNLSHWKSFSDTPFLFDMGPRKYTSPHLPEAYRRGLKYLLWCW